MHTYIFYLLIVFLPSQLGLHFWPDWALILGRRIDYLSPTLFFTDMLVSLTLLAWVIELLVLVIKRKAHTSPVQSVFQYGIQRPLLFLFPFFVYMQIQSSVNKSVTLYHWVKVIEFVLLGMYIIRTKPNVFAIARLFSVAVLYSSVLAIWQFVLQHSVGGIFWWLGERTFSPLTPGIAQIPLCLPVLSGCPLVLRAYATFPHPNVLGGFLAVSLTILVATSSGEMQSAVRIWIRRGAIFLGIIALILTFSRSAWIVGILGTSWAVLKNKQHFRVRYGLFIFCVGCFALLTLTTISPDSESVVVRQHLNAAAVQLWRHSWLMGVGLGNFLVSLPAFLPSRLIYFLQPVHNIYLLFLVENGITGAALLSVSVWLLLHKRKPLIINTGAIALCLLLILGLVDHYPLSLQQGQLLFTVMIALSLFFRPRW